VGGGLDAAAHGREAPGFIPGRLTQFYRLFGFRQVRRAARGKMRRLPGKLKITPLPSD